MEISGVTRPGSPGPLLPVLPVPYEEVVPETHTVRNCAVETV